MTSEQAVYRELRETGYQTTALLGDQRRGSRTDIYEESRDFKEKVLDCRSTAVNRHLATTATDPNSQGIKLLIRYEPDVRSGTEDIDLRAP